MVGDSWQCNSMVWNVRLCNKILAQYSSFGTRDCLDGRQWTLVPHSSHGVSIQGGVHAVSQLEMFCGY